MTGHKHAALMALYAQDAAETDKPWERWEHRGSEPTWLNLCCHPSWRDQSDYRRKPQSVNRTITYPEPVAEPLANGQRYFVPNMGLNRFSSSFIWQGDSFDSTNLRYGLIHLTSEAATAHAKALIGEGVL